MAKMVKEIGRKIEDNYVTHAEFEPIKKLVFKIMGTVVVGIVTAIGAMLGKFGGVW